MNMCQKVNCNKPTRRSKFCIDHKRKIKNERDVDEAIKITSEKYIDEERKLKNEQEAEYKLCLEHDRKILEDNQLQKILAESLDNYYIERKKQIENMKNNEHYTIKIKFSTDSIIKKFDISSNLSDIFNIIDIYIYENKLNINNYTMVLNFPKVIFTKENKDTKLYELNLDKNFVLYVYDLDN